ncbi:class I SAM-dependent DNA methyltransferase [Streptomyces sp. IB2014 016-6]|uniref:type I restriction-modification system subunit M n=1 Tax=Streptomyces sp. IB2014 016-6 TaxID=2517818 RepID=UPI0011C873AA|nr:class I SAM-dependent DNA methyltransferase [Streptomyces sp. IB2014 016-6]TXL89279.1 SAM-dependent DNA methyltransferase [Streptomyces sp. IB2014 016-6]
MQEIKHALWKAADKLRGSVDATEYKEYVLGLIFLKYLSDAFEEYRSERRALLIAEGAIEDRLDELLEDRELTDAPDIWVPRTARWSWIAAHTDTAHVGELIDEAMNAIAEANPSLTGALPTTAFRHGTVDQRRLAEVVDLISRVRIGDTRDRSARDVLGEVFEYFLDNFARAERKRGGESRTPWSVCQLVVGILEPSHGRVYDPACGTGGLLVQVGKYVESRGGSLGDLEIYGQEIDERTWRLARMNLAVHGMRSGGGAQWGDTLADDKHPDLKADFVMAQPPFNVSNRVREADPRWEYGVPSRANANYAWLQHAISKLSERGSAGIVLANGSLDARSPGERQIRQALVEADLVAAIVALPGQLFHSTQIPACLWVLTKDKSPERRGRILFIDAHDMGTMVSSTERVLSDEDLAKITDTYHAYWDEPGFCVSAGLTTVREEEYVLTPGRYVRAAQVPARTRALTKDLYGVFN